jgi:hypothetical protein
VNDVRSVLHVRYHRRHLDAHEVVGHDLYIVLLHGSADDRRDMENAPAIAEGSGAP